MTTTKQTAAERRMAKATLKRIIKIVHVKQIDGGMRLLAVTGGDADLIRRDRAMIDAVTVLGALDVYRDGRICYGVTGPLWRDVADDVKCALKYEAAQ